MVGMTEGQYQLGLGMMAADIGSGMSKEQRLWARELLVLQLRIPTSWKFRVEDYLAERQIKREEEAL